MAINLEMPSKLQAVIDMAHDGAAEMLRPMLKDWLDDNLPALVERQVQEEIARVSRGRR